jgi:hypothetical protein
MAQVGQCIENPVTGQTIIFRATGQNEALLIGKSKEMV